MIKVNRQKPYENYYHLYINGKKIKSKSNFDLKTEDIITLKEDNIFYSNFWFLYALANLIFGLFGSFDNFKHAKLTQRILRIQINGFINNTVEISFPSYNIENIEIRGVTSFEIVGDEVLNDSKTKKRITFARRLLIIFPICILILIAAILLAVLI